MNERWPQQLVFIERVKQFARKHGHITARGAVRLDIVSDMFNISESTLRQSLQYKSKSRLHYDTLAYIAGVIGCSVTEFMDDPGDSPPGISNEKWSELSEQERVFLSRIFTDMTRPDLSLTEKEALFAGYEEMRSRFFKLKEMWVSEPRMKKMSLRSCGNDS